MVSLSDWKVTRYQKKLVKQVLKSGRLTYGPVTKEFENRLAVIEGRKHALFTSSGTDALKIALGALKDRYGWQDGDEVIIPAVTFIASLNVVLMNNLKPVLVDVDPLTANLDPSLIEQAITKKTRAIMPVHLFGQQCDMKAILKIAKKHNLKVIEDSCETMFIPNKYQGDVVCYSTYLSHLLVTGVGGVIMTNDSKLATSMRSMMFHGRDESYLSIDDNHKTGKDFDKMIKNRFLFTRFGYSDRATEMEAALGLGALERWEENIIKRRRNAEYLVDQLPYVHSPITDLNNHAFMFLPVYADERDRLVEHLEKRGIQTRTMMPLTNQPIVKKLGIKEKDYPIARWTNQHGLLLPCHQYLTKADLFQIVKAFEEFYV